MDSPGQSPAPGSALRRAWEWAYHRLPPSDAPVGRRILRAIPRFPGDFLLERTSWAGKVVDAIVFPTALALGMGPGAVLALAWLIGEVPSVVTFGRAVAHRSPHAQPGQWWHRDWTYWTRPGARQPLEIGPAPQHPMETAPTSHHIPKWERWLVQRAEQKGRFSIPGFFDDWLNQRSRVAGWVIEHAYLGAGALLGVSLLPLFLLNTLVIGNISEAVAWYMGIREGDVRRATRPGVFQRDGDVVTAPTAPETTGPGAAVPPPAHRGHNRNIPGRVATHRFTGEGRPAARGGMRGTGRDVGL